MHLVAFCIAIGKILHKKFLKKKILHKKTWAPDSTMDRVETIVTTRPMSATLVHTRLVWCTLNPKPHQNMHSGRIVRCTTPLHMGQVRCTQHPKNASKSPL